MKKQWINIRFQFAVSLALASTDIAEELLTIIIMFFNQNNFWKRDEFEETRPVLPWAQLEPGIVARVWGQLGRTWTNQRREASLTASSVPAGVMMSSSLTRDGDNTIFI